MKFKCFLIIKYTEMHKKKYFLCKFVNICKHTCRHIYIYSSIYLNTVKVRFMIYHDRPLFSLYLYIINNGFVLKVILKYVK